MLEKNSSNYYEYINFWNRFSFITITAYTQRKRPLVQKPAFRYSINITILSISHSLVSHYTPIVIRELTLFIKKSYTNTFLCFLSLCTWLSLFNQPLSTRELNKENSKEPYMKAVTDVFTSVCLKINVLILVIRFCFLFFCGCSVLYCYLCLLSVYWLFL